MNKTELGEAVGSRACGAMIVGAAVVITRLVYLGFRALIASERFILAAGCLLVFGGGVATLVALGIERYGWWATDD